MNDIIKLDKNGIKILENKISGVSADIKGEMTEILEIVSNIDFAWNGDDKERYLSELNDRAKFLVNVSKLLDSFGDTLNYINEKNNSLNSFDNINNLYKDGGR